MLLLRSGDRAMISEAAANATLIIAIVAGSIVKRGTIALILVSPTDVIQALGVLRYGPPSFRVPLRDLSSSLFACVPTVR